MGKALLAQRPLSATSYYQLLQGERLLQPSDPIDKGVTLSTVIKRVEVPIQFHYKGGDDNFTTVLKSELDEDCKASVGTLQRCTVEQVMEKLVTTRAITHEDKMDADEKQQRLNDLETILLYANVIELQE